MKAKQPISSDSDGGGFHLFAIVALGLGLAALGLGSIFDFVLWGRPEDAWIATGLIIAGLEVANFARMLQIWRELKPALTTSPRKRRAAQRKTVERGFRELFAYTFLVVCGLTVFAFVSAAPGWSAASDLHLHGTGPEDANVVNIAILIAAIGLSFVPLLTGFYLQARAEEVMFERKFWRRDAISIPSFWMSALLLGSIVALASWAAGQSGTGSKEIASGLTFFITLAVIGLFVAFIFLPHLVRYLERSGNRSGSDGIRTQGINLISLPAQVASYVDCGLVRLVAPLTGATQNGAGVPHSFVLLTLIPLTALGFILAPPYGLLPIAFGMLMVIALGRRWAWIEEDRETASRLLKTESPEIQVGFENDLKDEALLGYASLFLLVPLALHQIYGWQTTAFEITDASRASNPFVAWLSFFGAELAKAVPFVDWWEIYQVDLDPPIAAAADNPLGKHLTFAARAMVDLVIMAALFQAIAIWQRSRAQKKLYQIGHVNHFEPFAEREFFEGAFRKGSQAPRTEFVEQIQKHVDAREILRLPGEPYNPDRLADLLKSDSYSVRRTAMWMVEKFQLLTGTPAEKLQQLVQQWSNLSFPQLSGSRHAADRKRLLNEKQKFEQLLSEFADDVSVVKLEEAGKLLGLLEDIRQIPELSFAQLEAIRLYGSMRNEYALLALVAHVLPPSETEWRTRIQNKFGRAPNLFLGQAPMRIKVYEALEQFGTNPPATRGIQRKTWKFLQLMAELDGAIPARDRASKAADRVKEMLDAPTPAAQNDTVAADEDPDLGAED